MFQSKGLRIPAALLVGSVLAVSSFVVPSHAASKSILVFMDSPRQSFARNFNPFVGQPLQPTQGGIYEPLMIIPYFGPKAGKAIPWLATSRKFSRDLKTITFTIRQGVKWSDGKPFTAADVAYTMNLEKNNAAVDRVGLSGTKPKISVSGNTVSLKYKTADVTGFAGFVDNLMIAPKHIWSKIPKPDTYTNPNPVGTGPFTKVQNFSPQSYDLAKNPYYWQKGKPHFDVMRFPAYSGNDTATNDLAAGKIDWAGLFIPHVNQVYDSKNPNFHHFYAQSVPVLFEVNDSKYPFSLPVLRHAISLVINRKAISVSAQDGYGKPSNLTGLSGMFQTWDNKKLNSKPVMNVSQARKLLTGAGFTYKGSDLVDPKGNTVSFDINVVDGWTDWDAAAQIISQNVKDIGISATPKPVQFGDYFSRCQLGNFTANIGWASAGASPYNFYHDQVGAVNYAPVGKIANGNAWERYHNSKLDKLFQLFQATVSRTKQHQIMNQVQTIWLRDLPAIPVIINPVWYEYSNAHFTGWPTQKNYYVNAAPYTVPDRLIVMNTIKPKAK